MLVTELIKISDKCSFHGNPQELIDKMNKREMETPCPPKSAYEILMEKQSRIKEGDVSIWFLDEECPECKKPLYTDGKLEWCGQGCSNFGKRGRKDKDGFGFINDLVR